MGWVDCNLYSDNGLALWNSTMVGSLCGVFSGRVISFLNICLILPETQFVERVFAPAPDIGMFR